MDKEFLISVDFDETRVAILEDRALVEYYVERPVNQRVVGNVYKGRVENVLPGMQAAFVDIGLERNAFLYVDDAVLKSGEDDEEISVHVHRAKIRDVLRVGQEILVQVVKEPVGTKGARVTRNLTLPGRHMVLMPTVDYVGISRRIQEDGERERLRKMAEKHKPHHMGVIVRTVAEGKSETDLSQDLDFLTRLWGRIQNKSQSAPAPMLIHKDLGLVYRIVRDLFSEDVRRFQIDNRHEYEKVLELLDIMSPHLKARVSLFAGRDRTLFDRYGLETELDQILNKKIWLKSGGYLVIDHVEALTVIDVNTGKFVGTTDLQDTVFRTNMEAAREIARQLRLRDIGGIIVADFIDMESADHRQQVLAELEQQVRRDRTPTNVLGLTNLGLVEITRKKMRQGLEAALQRPCPYCEGRGRTASEETMASKVRREIRRVFKHSTNEAVLIELYPTVAALVIGAGGGNLKELERETGRSVFIRGSKAVHLEGMNIRAFGTHAEVEAKALPVKLGQVLDLTITEPHVTNPWDGIARIDGYVVDIEGAGKLVGETVKVEITRAFRTYARARLTG